MTICISQGPTPKSPAAIPSSKRLLAVGEQKRSGLILCKPYYAEFAGPGAAIGSSVEQTHSLVIAIGSPDIIEVVNHQERQRAYGRRIQWVRWLQKIVAHPDPIQRVERLFSGFEEFFCSEVLLAIPDEVMGLLAGVLPQTVASARSQNSRFDRSEKPEDHRSLEKSQDLNIGFIQLDCPSSFAHNPSFANNIVKTIAATQTNFAEVHKALPCSA